MIRSFFLSAFGGALVVSCAAVLIAAAPAPDDAKSPAVPASAPAAAERWIDFVREVQPILEARCIQCHGPTKQHADLRLDLRESAMAGGNSGRRFVGVPVNQNELLRRVSGDVAEIRMPLEGDPLTPAQIETIRLWAEQGAYWGDAPAPSASVRRPPPPIEAAPWHANFYSWLDGALPWINPAIGWCEAALRDYASLVYAVLAVLVLFVVAGRFKPAAESSDDGPSASASVLGSAIGLFTPTVFYVAILALGGWGVVLYGRVRDRGEADLAAKIESLRGELATARRPVPNGLGKDSKPVALRPHHPKRLGGEYYRGNDERNEALFNGGNYRTATMRIALCGDDKQPLVWGDKVPPGKLYVRLEIERANLATPALFSDDLLKKVFLSCYTTGEIVADPKEEIVALQATTAGERWQAYCPLPIAASADSSSAKGEVFVYVGRVAKGKIEGAAHYGIVYDLQLQSGRIAPTSELWMGSRYHTDAVEFPTPGRIPLQEWFDFRPIPEIEKGNSTDAKLLGIPEHLPLAPSPDKGRSPSSLPSPEH